MRPNAACIVAASANYRYIRQDINLYGWPKITSYIYLLKYKYFTVFDMTTHFKML